MTSRSVRHPSRSAIIISLASALLSAGAVAVAWTVTSGDSGAVSRGGRVDIGFERGPPDGVRLLERSGVLAAAVKTVNDEVALPSDLHVRVVGPVTAAQAGADGPMYVPSRRTVYLPWSFFQQSRAELARLELLRKTSRAQLDQIAKSAMVFVLYHELAHGLINVLDIPVVASEEEMADSFASVLAIASGRSGEIVPLSAAALSEAHSEARGAPALADYADDHGFDRARAFNDLCLVYGSAPARFSKLLAEGFLPSTRARVCPFDYQRTLRSWGRLVAGSLRHKQGLVPLGP